MLYLCEAWQATTSMNLIYYIILLFSYCYAQISIHYPYQS